MAIKDQSSIQTHEETLTFSCEYYSPRPGSKRCMYYLFNGACDRPEEFMCLEWMKANDQFKPESQPKEKAANDVDRNLFSCSSTPRSKPLEKILPKPEKQLEAKPAPTTELPLVRNLSDEEISSFKALGAEVCINSEEVGKIWLVPQYTGQDRREISVEHAVTLFTLCSTLPGAKIVSFEKKRKLAYDSN